MDQPTIACYFNARKRVAVEDAKINRAKKVLILDSDINSEKSCIGQSQSEDTDVHVKNVILPIENKSELKQKNEEKVFVKKVVTISNPKPKVTPKSITRRTPKVKNVKSKILEKNHNIQEFICNMKNTVNTELVQNEICKSHVTPPTTPTKITNALDKIRENPDGPSLKELKKKMCRSARLAELKASISRFQEGDNKLKEIEKETKKIPESPKLKSFKTIELEVLTRSVSTII